MLRQHPGRLEKLANRLMRLWRAIIGYREDLQLQSRWWHRLFTVLFVLLMLMVGLASLCFVLDTPPTIDNCQILISLRVFTKRYGSGKTNVIPAFIAADGKTGQFGNGGTWVSWVDEDALKRADCNIANSLPRKGEVLKFSPEELAPGDLEVIAQTLPNEARGDLNSSYCTVPVPSSLTERQSADQIVKYRIRPFVYMRNLAVACLAVVACAFVLSTLYYRGFIYVVCGSRHKPASL